MTMPEVKTAISIASLNHHYGKQPALIDVSLALPAGEAIAVVGPDGVGKSTLLGLIAGTKKIQNGKVSILGFDISNKRGRSGFLSCIAYMPQGLGKNLYPTLSVRENIDFFGRLFGLGAAERAAQIARLLEATGLAPFPDRPAGKLSGGMKQKLGLCCALVHAPDLLILDEPTTGVDPLSRRQFWELVDSMRAERPSLTVLVSTAYMEEAERFNTLIAMDAGRIIAQGRTAEIIATAGAHTLEEAYISLLPEKKRPIAADLTITPWHDDGGAPAIEAHDLTRRFGDFVAVDRVSFRIGRGEIFGFLGSNGCGKSTSMKMLTGLLDVSGGEAKLFGRVISAGDMQTRMRVGYMSQAFSLYEELSVRQNLMLHARLYRLPKSHAELAVRESLKQFELSEYENSLPGDLPLGIRQRLQLSAACLHTPEILILDEPTSGVDPAARDMFWRHLVRLSREDGVTIFVSTHFMNEAERCDRISLMHRGRVLAVGTPRDLQKQHGMTSLEDAFIAELEANADSSPIKAAIPAPTAAVVNPTASTVQAEGNWLGYAWAFARREALELVRDPARLAFAIAGPLILLCIASYSVSFDVQHLRFAVLDSDHSQLSRDVQRAFEGSAYFDIYPPIADQRSADAAIRDGGIQLVLEIPPGFARDLSAKRQPALSLLIDGANPFPASNAQSYAEAILFQFNSSILGASAGSSNTASVINIVPRFIYNQDFKSIYAMAPGVLMLCMILIPAMLTALGVVREKEIGSIINLYASPASRGAFLVGKQAPYAALAMLSFVILFLVVVLILRVPLQGSFLALALGALLFVLAVTSLGLMISAFVRSQVAAIFATAIICLIPSVNFSGLLYPVSTMEGPSYWMGQLFPSAWFQIISLGAFTKGLDIDSFVRPYFMLGLIALVFIVAARLSLRKQEA